MSNARPQWSGQKGFTLAVAGAAIGLGGIWRIPYLAGANGGGAFLLVYLACLALVGLPLLVAELSIGQTSRKSPIRAFHAPRARAPWRYSGHVAASAAVATLVISAVTGGWVLDFAARSVAGDYGGGLASLFDSPVRQLFFTTVFLAAAAAIVGRGARGGLERWNRILVGGLVALLAIFLARAASLDGFGSSVSYLLRPDFSRLSWQGALLALGQAFFTLSLGVGAMVTYGGYASRGESPARAALAAAALDTGVALAAGLASFSILFSQGATPAAGPALLFQALPPALSGLAGGHLAGALFFACAALAALAAAVALLETAVSCASDSAGWTRRKATLGAAGLVWLIALPCALSTSALREVTIAGRTPFELVDWAATSVLIPVAALATALYSGWVAPPKGVKPPLLLKAARIAVPAAIALILVRGLLG